MTSAYRPADVLPHRGSLLLLDEVLDHGEDHAECALTIREGAPFFLGAGPGVPSWVGLEYLAQTVAVFGGIRRVQRGLAVQVALLLGTRGYRCGCDYFRVGERLLTRAERVFHDASGVGVYRCTLSGAGSVLAESEIKAYQPEDISDYLQMLKEAEPRDDLDANRPGI